MTDTNAHTMELLIAQRPTQRADETRDTFGARVFIYILHTDITGPFTDVELETALAASLLAGCNPALLATTRQTYANLRHRITSLLDARRRDAKRGTPIAIAVPDAPRTDGSAPVRPMRAPIAPPPLDGAALARQKLAEAF